MTKTRKFRLVRLGDAKVLTRGEVGSGDELVTMHRPQPWPRAVGCRRRFRAAARPPVPPGPSVKETTMTKKQAKTRLVRLGDAKHLTKGEFGQGDELITSKLRVAW